MPFKTDASGAIAVVEVNGTKLPVFIHGDGKELPFDADSTLGTISRLNGEAKNQRERAEKAETTLKTYEGISDPAAAIKALGVVSNLDLKKLVDAGEVDKVRSEVGKAMQLQIDALAAEKGKLSTQLFNLQVGSAFTNSAFIKTKIAPSMPTDFLQARFGGNFKVENGTVHGVDASGQKLYSRIRAGEVADFDEALSMMIESHPQRDTFLKGTGSSGGGSQGSGGGAGGGSGGKRTITRSAWEAIGNPQERAKAATEMAIVDG